MADGLSSTSLTYILISVMVAILNFYYLSYSGS